MKIIKEKSIIKVIDDDFVEEYSLEKEITFGKLVSFLLSKNLSIKIKLDDETKDNTDNEQSLINLIKEIINKYNQEYEEYQKFLKELTNNE